MTRYAVLARREVFRRWWKWTPALAAWFFVLFFEAWLNSERLKNDYEYWRLMQEFRGVEAEMRTVQVDEAALETHARLDARAAELGMCNPNPGQVQNFTYTPAINAAPQEPVVLAEALEENPGLESAVVSLAPLASAVMSSVGEKLGYSAIAEPAAALPVVTPVPVPEESATAAVTQSLAETTPETVATAATQPATPASPDESPELLMGSL